MTGHQKQQKINCLIEFNEWYRLGLDVEEIKEYSIAQLRRKLLEIRIKYRLPMSSQTKTGMIHNV